MQFVKSFLSTACFIVATGLVSFFVPVVSAQTNTVPVGTSGNRYVLSIRNNFPWTFDSVHVKVISSPSWVTFQAPEVTIDSIQPGLSEDAAFDFSVSDVQAGLSDSVRLLITDCMGHGFEIRTIPFTTELLAAQTGMDAAYPNPSNPSTTIRYSLQNQGWVSLIVYDILGRRVRTLVDGEMSPGQHSIVWNGMDDHGTTVASGVYFVRLVAKGKGGIKQFTSKILMLK